MTAAPLKKEQPDNIRAMAGIVKGATINLFGTGSHLLVAFLYSVFLTRVLSAEDLGRFFLGFTILNFLVIVAVLGYDFAIWRYVAIFMGRNEPDKARGVVVSSLSVTVPAGILVGLTWYLGGDWLGTTVFSDDNQGLVFRMFAIALPFMVVARVLNASTQGLRKMHYQVISKDLGEQVVRFAMSAALVTFGLMGVLGANIIAAVATLLLAFWFLQMNLPIVGRHHPVEKQLKLVTAFSFPLIFSTIFGYLFVWVDTVILGYYMGASDVGLYSVAARVAILGTLVLTAFNTMFSPVISDLHSRQEGEMLSSLFKFVTKWVVTISLPVFILVILFAKPALMIFGEGFVAAASALMILALGQFVNSATGPVGGMVTMSGRPYLDLANNLAAVLANIGLCLLLIPRWGMVGAATANAVAIGGINVIRAVEVYFILGVQGYDRSYLKPVLAVVVASLAAYGIYLIADTGVWWLGLVIAAVFMSAYVVMLAVAGFDDDDRAMARLVKKRLAVNRSA